MRSTTQIDLLTPESGPCVHRYYDVPIEEPETGRILYFRFDGPIPGPGTVVVAEPDGAEPQLIGRGEEAIGHVGAQQTWFGKGRVSYSPRQQTAASALLVDLATGETAEIPYNVRSYCEATDQAALIAGAGGARSSQLENLQTLWLHDVASGRTSRLLTAEQAHAIHPARGKFSPEISNFQNAKFSPDGKELFVVFGTEVYKKKTGKRDTFTAKCLIATGVDGSNVRFVGEFGHHPMWTPDGRSIIAYCKRPDGRQDLMRYDPAGGDEPETYLSDFGGVHASLDAAQERLVTDVYDYDKKTAKVVLVDIASGTERVLAEGKHDSADHIEGTHVHPQWSRDEKRIYFNHADSGEPKLYAACL